MFCTCSHPLLYREGPTTWCQKCGHEHREPKVETEPVAAEAEKA